jgi:hypothetical protein
MENSFRNSFQKLSNYVEQQNYQGWDPYDGLESRLLKSIPLSDNKYFRLAWIQFFKRSPINFRRIAGVPKGYNAKGLALFISSYCIQYGKTPTNEIKGKIQMLTNLLLSMANSNFSGACWGYNFDWQARAFFQPKNMPTVVATTYCACALLDAYEILGDERLLKTARSSCDFVLNDLNRTYNENGDFSFSYSPRDSTQVFNASFLGSRLLSRVYKYLKEDELRTQAEKSVKFCCEHQHVDGSWPYGTLPFHHWIDSFHTGFNLECLAEFERHTGIQTYHKHLERGFHYYLSKFFTELGESKYFSNSIYPIDIHSPAQLVVTLYRLGKLDEQQPLVQKVLLYTIRNMQDPTGYFYYQKKKWVNSKIPYMRWAQAWMFFAFSIYLTNFDDDKEKN